MRVEVWSDVVCPWCYVGKRRLESALERFEHRDEVDVVWRSFELDRDAPRRREVSAAEHLARKYAMSAEQVAASWARLTALAESEGLEFHLDRTLGGSTFDAHRLIHLGVEHGLQDEVKERFLRAYFTEGAPIGEPEALDRLATEAGLPSAKVAEVLASDRLAAQVREDERRARLLGIGGVPFLRSMSATASRARKAPSFCSRRSPPRGPSTHRFRASTVCAGAALSPRFAFKAVQNRDPTVSGRLRTRRVH